MRGWTDLTAFCVLSLPLPLCPWSLFTDMCCPGTRLFTTLINQLLNNYREEPLKYS